MMVKEIERAGIPAVHVVNMTMISENIGANRILRSYSIPSPMADCNEVDSVRKEQRYHLMKKAIKALSTEITKQTIFD